MPIISIPFISHITIQIYIYVCIKYYINTHTHIYIHFHHHTAPPIPSISMQTTTAFTCPCSCSYSSSCMYLPLSLPHPLSPSIRPSGQSRPTQMSHLQTYIHNKHTKHSYPYPAKSTNKASYPHGHSLYL